METFFPKLKLRELGIILGLIALFLGLATWNLTRLPIFVDEAIYLRWAQIAWHDSSWRFISLTDGKQPLYIWLVIPFMKLISDPLAAGRMASVVSGLFSMLGLGYLGWLLAGKKTGLLAMVLMTFSPYLFFYYRFGIMESTLVASIIWVLSISVLLARTRRLDVALILGMVTGLALLAKSSALFFCLLIPAAYLLVVDFKKILTKSTLQYGILVLIAWFLAFVIYNIQRLSPFMHIIAEKNAFFTVPYSEIFREPARILNNAKDVWRWQYAYTTMPVIAVSLYGMFRMLRSDKRSFWLLMAWAFGPTLGTVLVARLFAPRYIIYLTPFILLAGAYGLAQLKSFRWTALAVIIVSLYPLLLIGKLITDPIHFPYVNIDEGYVNGWPAGNGVKQIGDWARVRAKEIGPTHKLVIYTEGTFGILPHGLELYTQGIKNLEVIGYYPIVDIPPVDVVAAAHENPETYLIMNNTLTPDVPGGLELVASYPKLRDNPMKLYKVIPR